MSVTNPPVTATSDTALSPAEGCPLCGTPLNPGQDWCLNCGAAAHTRLAAAPGWRAPLIGMVLVIVLALGALTAALVELAGAPPSSTPVTRTLTTPAGVVPPTAAPTTTVPPTTLPGANLPGTTPKR